MSRTRSGGLTVAILAVAAYVGGMIALRYVIAAVAGAVEQARAGSTITGDVIAEAMADPTPVHHVAALVVAGVFAIVLIWPGADRRGPGATASGHRVLWPGLLFVGGLTLFGQSLGEWLGQDWPFGPSLATDIPAAWWVLLAVVHPLAVELVFRSCALGRALDSGIRPVLAVLLQAVLFCLVAPTWATALLALSFALVAGWLRTRTGSPWSAVVLHYLLFVALAVVTLVPAQTGTSAGQWLLVAIGLTAAVAGFLLLFLVFRTVSTASTSTPDVIEARS